MKVLVTGAGGLTGHYLAGALFPEAGVRLYLTDRRKCPGQDFIKCDLTVKGAVARLIAKVKPQQVYHAAGTFTNDYAIDYPANVLSTKNILDAVLASKLSCRVLLVGSSAEYGAVQLGDNPVKESQPLRPLRVYGLTKAFQSLLMGYYCRVYRMDIVMARTFNLYGDAKLTSRSIFPGRASEGIEEIKRGRASRIRVGNLESERDYIDVREAVQYYRKIMDKGRCGEAYNVGSGRPLKVREFLAGLLKEAGLGTEVIEEALPSVADETDIPAIYADLTKLKGL